MLKILYFSGCHQIFQISPGIKSRYGRGRKLSHLLAGGGGGGAEFGTGEAISANLSTGEAIWAYLTVVFGQGVFLFQDLYICQVFSWNFAVWWHTHIYQLTRIIIRIIIELTHSKTILENISQEISQEITCAGISFRPATLSKRGSYTVVFLWNLWNF